MADIELGKRIAIAYHTAHRVQAYDGYGRVEVHVGLDIFTTLRTMAVKSDDSIPGRPAPTVWGFPLVLDRAAKPDSIAVHVIHTIL